MMKIVKLFFSALKFSHYRFFAVLFLALTILLPSFSADYYGRDVPDSSEIRAKLVDRWFLQDLKYLRLQENEYYQNVLGQKFEIRMEEIDDDTFAIVVAPASKIDMDLISSSGKSTVEMDVYPYDSSGSWILFRDKKTGNPMSIRYYFHKNSQIFVEFQAEDIPDVNITMKKRKKDEKVYGNFLLFDMYVAKNIPVGLTIESLYTMPFVEVVENTRITLPWEFALIETNLYDDNLQMIGFIREKLPGIVFENDACYDGEFNPVRISTGEKREEKAKKGGVSLDNFGFTKWIVDGIVRPMAGSNLELAPLKTPTVKMKVGSKADTFADKYNQFFALDWTRNLAAAYLSVVSADKYTYENSGCEVSIRPFSAQFTQNGTKSLPVYIKDSGYFVESLKALFYILAIREPGRFYLGAIRETDNSVPQNVFYARTVAFFPYFDAEGDYFVSVFENGKECSIEDFMKDNSDVFVNLVRFQSSQRFFPQ